MFQQHARGSRRAKAAHANHCAGTAKVLLPALLLLLEVMETQLIFMILEAGYLTVLWMMVLLSLAVLIILVMGWLSVFFLKWVRMEQLLRTLLCKHFLMI